MRNIKYVPKKTRANTQYIKISSTDLKYILTKLNYINDFINKCENVNDKQITEVYNIYCTKIDELPKMGYYPYNKNSIRSFISGILHNFNIGSQLDLTKNILVGLELVFEISNHLLVDIEQVKFVESLSITKNVTKNYTYVDF